MKKKAIVAIALALCAAVLVSVAGVAIACRNTDIPKLYFEGNIEKMYEKSDVRDISFTYDDGESVTKGYATLKVQGTSSLGYDKKNYTINMYADEAHEEKLKIDLGWGAQSKYCLKANWIDRTHARNIVTANLVTQMQQKYNLLTEAPCNGAIDGFPIEIYNNGSFHGLYTFNIPKDDWQFAMDGDNPDHIVLGGEWHNDDGLFKAQATGFETWSVEVGEESEETLAKLNRLLEFFVSTSDEEFKANFDQYMNLDALLNYYIMTDFAYLPDNLSKNMLLATYDGKVWYPSLYDLDTSWGADFHGKELYDYKNEMVNQDSSNLFERLEDCFPQELAQRYFELRQDILTKENVMEKFNAFRAEIPFLTVVQDAVKWGTGLIRQPSDLPGFDYDQIEAYLDYMIPVLDAKYTEMQNG